MRLVIALVLLLLAAPLARAEELKPEEKVRPTVVQTEEKKPAAADLELSNVKVPEAREARSDAATTQEMPRRGSFWWLVGVIVVAGIILAVLV